MSLGLGNAGTSDLLGKGAPGRQRTLEISLGNKRMGDFLGRGALGREELQGEGCLSLGSPRMGDFFIGKYLYWVITDFR